MIWPFRKKITMAERVSKISENVTCRIVDVSEVSMPYSSKPIPYNNEPLIIAPSDKGLESLSNDESIVENVVGINKEKEFNIEDLGFGGCKRGPDWLKSKNLKTED